MKLQPVYVGDGHYLVKSVYVASIREPQQDKKREKHSANTDTNVKDDPVDKTVKKTAVKKTVENSFLEVISHKVVLLVLLAGPI